MIDNVKAILKKLAIPGCNDCEISKLNIVELNELKISLLLMVNSAKTDIETIRQTSNNKVIEPILISNFNYVQKLLDDVEKLLNNTPSK